MCAEPFSPWPCFSKEEISAVTDVLSSNKVNYWTGDQCRQFEREFAQFVGCRYAIASFKWNYGTRFSVACFRCG